MGTMSSPARRRRGKGIQPFGAEVEQTLKAWIPFPSAPAALRPGKIKAAGRV